MVFRIWDVALPGMTAESEHFNWDSLRKRRKKVAFLYIMYASLLIHCQWKMPGNPAQIYNGGIFSASQNSNIFIKKSYLFQSLTFGIVGQGR